MIRVACLLGLIALAIVILVAVHPDGATATIFSFVGIPALVTAMGLYVLRRWQAGAFHVTGTSRPPTR
jgi:hypothetical protein